MKTTTRKEMNPVKKDWGGIVAKVQTFVPQEYCDVCATKPVTQLSGWGSTGQWRYIDLNGDGCFNVGERFLTTTGQCTYPNGISDQTTGGNVNIYNMTLSSGNTNDHSFEANQPYQDHSYNNISYKVTQIASEKIKIVSNTAYLFEVNAS